MSDVEVPPRPLNAFFAFRTLSHYARTPTGKSKSEGKGKGKASASPSNKQINAPEFLSAHPSVARKIRSCFTKVDIQLKSDKERQGTFSKACSAAWKEFRSDRECKAWREFERLVESAVEEHRRRWPDYVYCPGARKTRGAVKATMAEKRARRREVSVEPSSSASSSAVSSPAPASPLTSLDELEDSFSDSEEPEVAEDDAYSPQMPTLGMDWTADAPLISQKHPYIGLPVLEKPALPTPLLTAPAQTTPYINVLAPWSPEAQVSVWSALGEPQKLDGEFTFPPLEETAGDGTTEWAYDAGWF